MRAPGFAWNWWRGSAAAVVLLASLASSSRRAEACQVLQLDFTPAPDPTPYPDSALQIVIWIEDARGNFVDTVYVTRSVGYYGIGNRPGEWEFPSDPLYPYGRRETVLPVWAHRRGKTYPRLVFQDGFDQDLSHSVIESSIEPYFCRPRLPSELTAGISCASKYVYTDKGMFDPTGAMSFYPPRGDLPAQSAGDSADEPKFASLDDLAGISRATPVGGMPVQPILYSIPPWMPPGSYVAYLEVAKEGDFNAFYHVPKPADIGYSEYGSDYIGQPSVVFAVPFTVGGAPDVETADHYAGYGDPLAGGPGTLHPPDFTITTGVDGSGEGRLLEQEDLSTGQWYRFRVQAVDAKGGFPPDAVGNPAVGDVGGESAAISFTAPAVPGTSSGADSYEVRVKAGDPPIDPADVAAFERLPVADGVPQPAAPGTRQTLALSGLQFSTHYSVGIRAAGMCPDSVSPIEVLTFTTSGPLYPQVDACFLATAAYGSLYRPQVALLRRFRDAVLEPSIAGRLLVQAYYTVSPPLAAVERVLPPVRVAVRGLLRPLGTFAAGALHVSGALSRRGR